MKQGYSQFNRNTSIENKREVIKNNSRFVTYLNNQIVPADFKAVSVDEGSNIEPESKPMSNPVPFDDTFKALFQKVISASCDDIRSIIASIIAKDDPNYFRYISMLKIALYKEMVALSNLAFEAKDIDNEDIQRMYNELEDIFLATTDIEVEEELFATSQNQNNTLFFRTSSNRVIPYEDISKGIPSDMYPQVLELITGLVNGDFKGLKYLHHKKMFEVRLGDIRITFVKLSNNKLLVLNCFLKKYYTSREYRERLYRTRDQYLVEKQSYLDKIDDPDFIKEHQKYLEDIILLCEPKRRER